MTDVPTQVIDKETPVVDVYVDGVIVIVCELKAIKLKKFKKKEILKKVSINLKIKNYF